MDVASGGHQEVRPSHRLSKGEHMYQRWPGLTLDNGVPVRSDKRTRVRRGVTLTHGRARQASGATNSPKRDARPPSPRVTIAAWLAFVAVISSGAPGWVCWVALVSYWVVLLFGISVEMKAQRRRSHLRIIGAHPRPDEENHDNRSSQRDGERSSASLARPQEGAPGAVSAMAHRLEPPDDDEMTRTPRAEPTRPRLRWTGARGVRRWA
jgi:hypothetical protein